MENVHLSVVVGQDDRSSADSISGIDIGSGFGQKSNLKCWFKIIFTIANYANLITMIKEYLWKTLNFFNLKFFLKTISRFLNTEKLSWSIYAFLCDCYVSKIIMNVYLSFNIKKNKNLLNKNRFDVVLKNCFVQCVPSVMNFVRQSQIDFRTF